MENQNNEQNQNEQPQEKAKFDPVNMTQPMPPMPLLPPMPPIGAVPPVPPVPPVREPLRDRHQEQAGEPGPRGSRQFQTGSLTRTPRLSISNFSGNITVRGADQDFISVRAVDDDRNADLTDVADVSYSPDGDFTVKVEPLQRMKKQVRRAREAFEMTRGNFFDNIANLVESVTQIGGNWFHADFEATVPRNCDLYLSTQSGEIKVEEVEGAIYLGTASGEIEAEDISGNVVVQTISGNVEIEGISGQLGLKSTSGDLEVRQGNLTGLYIGTTSGDAEVEAFLHPGKYEVRSVSGDITLKVQREFAAAMSGRTISGDFECALPYQQVDPRGRKEDDDDSETDGDFNLKVDDFTLKVDVPGFRWEYPGGRRGPGAEGGKRRRRNRWEFLIGDPATASQSATRLRVRTISGDLKIERGNSKPQPAPTSSGQQISEQDFTRPLRSDEADTVVRADERAARQQEREARQHEHEARRHTHEQERASREQERANREQQRVSGGGQSGEQSRASILQAVENKQISVDEALRLLSLLER